MLKSLDRTGNRPHDPHDVSGGTVGSSLTTQQVLDMAPDERSAAAGKKLRAPSHWSEVGASNGAYWGLCQGSKVYQVKIDRGNLGYACSCPSRKFPCKHVLGLLLLLASEPDDRAPATEPDWVSEWLAAREKRQAKKSAAPSADKMPGPEAEKAREKRQAAREKKVLQGLDHLDLWLTDLLKNGLAGLERARGTLFEDMARRLVDCQAGGVAARVRRLVDLPGSSPEWPRTLLAELGRLKLISHAYRRADSLRPELASDLRSWIGFNVSADEIERHGDVREDRWWVLGQWVDEQEQVRTQRSWLVGMQSEHIALVLQFAPGNRPFGETIVPGHTFQAKLAFYPGASAQRAKILERSDPAPLDREPPGHVTLNAFLASVTENLARAPWTRQFGAVLHDMRLVCSETGEFTVLDRSNQGLPVRGSSYRALALTGSHPCTWTAEWDGQALRLLGMRMGTQYEVSDAVR